MCNITIIQEVFFFHTHRRKVTSATTSPSDIFIDPATGMFIPLCVVFLPLMIGLCVLMQSLVHEIFTCQSPEKMSRASEVTAAPSRIYSVLYFLSPIIRLQRQTHTSVQAFQWILLWIFGPHSYQDTLFSGQMLRNQWLRKVLQFPEKSLRSAETCTTIGVFCYCSWMLISNRTTLKTCFQLLFVPKELLSITPLKYPHFIDHSARTITKKAVVKW